MKHILSAGDFSKDDIENVFALARRKVWPRLAGKVMAALFYEPSTRTYGSFLSAMQRLGGGFIPLNGMGNTSVGKGETFRDTVETFSKLSDIIVVRHPDVGSAHIAAEVSLVPVINAGDGRGEHPTQALLDLFTIQSHFPDISDLTITLVGDLKNGRTVHSLYSLLLLYHTKKINFVSPRELAMPGITGSDDLEKVLPETDVLYMTRVQKERFSDPLVYERLKDSFCVTPMTMKKLKKTAILMHPLPRINEISTDVDSDRRSLYFREQIQNGMYVRMALLSRILTP